MYIPVVTRLEFAFNEFKLFSYLLKLISNYIILSSFQASFNFKFLVLEATVKNLNKSDKKTYGRTAISKESKIITCIETRIN